MSSAIWNVWEANPLCFLGKPGKQTLFASLESLVSKPPLLPTAACGTMPNDPNAFQHIPTDSSALKGLASLAERGSLRSPLSNLHRAALSCIELSSNILKCIELLELCCNLNNHCIRLCFGQCELYDESPKVSTAQCSSMQFNTTLYK